MRTSENTNAPTRREMLIAAGALAASAALPAAAKAQERRFEPRPGRWRSFEITTRVEIQEPSNATRVWLPVPSIDSDYQKSLESRWTGNAAATRIVADTRYGAKMLYAAFDAGTPIPTLVLTSRVQTQDRATDWGRSGMGQGEDAASLRSWTRPTELLPTDGIVLDTARQITRGAGDDRTRVRQIYDWIVANTHREPTVRGCGVGDIKTMLETGDFSGKCGDINGLFVGLCRAVGVPARDLYGLRVAPSAFGYRELGSDPAKLQGAQHCRAEVWLEGHGWVAMDPADVGKVMRQETPMWIKDESNPVVAPVRRALFGGWEGNWIGFNNAHDVALPGAAGSKLGFFMYPQAENANGRYDALDPEHFKYSISAQELAA
ncbi:MAG: transglutaminase family protein [Rhizobacter sp.]